MVHVDLREGAPTGAHIVVCCTALNLMQRVAPDPSVKCCFAAAAGEACGNGVGSKTVVGRYPLGSLRIIASNSGPLTVTLSLDLPDLYIEAGIFPSKRAFVRALFLLLSRLTSFSFMGSLTLVLFTHFFLSEWLQEKVKNVLVDQLSIFSFYLQSVCCHHKIKKVPSHAAFKFLLKTTISRFFQIGRLFICEHRFLSNTP